MTLFQTARKRGRPFKKYLLPAWLALQENRIWQSSCAFLKNRRPPRQVHAFSVGLPKTGTTSIAKMMVCNSAHEPETHTLLHIHDRHLAGLMTPIDQARVLRARDSVLWLELESNHMFGLVIDALVLAFPEAKFILTVREPRSWLESQINQHYEQGHIEPFRTAYKRMYGGVPTSTYDEKLTSKGLYGVSGYLQHWGAQNRKVLASVPNDKLKVVWTHHITEQADEIAEFLGLDSVEQVNAHRNRRPNKKLILDDLVDPGYLRDQIAYYTEDAAAELRSWRPE